MAISWHPLANLPVPKGGLWQSADFWWTGVLFLAGIIILAWIWAWLKRWRTQTTTLQEGPADVLAQYQTLYDQGELDETEFARIKAQILTPVKEPPTGPAREPRILELVQPRRRLDGSEGSAGKP